MSKFYIVRHGQTQYNIDMIMQGWVDSPLTQLGQQQALKAGKYLSNVNFDRCICSDLGRTVATAKLILTGKDTPIIKDQRLREVCFGIYDGDLIDNVPLKHYRTRIEYDWTEFKGETYDSVGNRFAQCLDEYATKYPNDTMLIVTHGGASMAMMKHYNYAMYDQMVSVENKFKNCATTVLDITDGKASFELINFDEYMHD